MQKKMKLLNHFLCFLIYLYIPLRPENEENTSACIVFQPF